MKKSFVLILSLSLFVGCSWINEYRVKSRAVEDHKRRIHTITRSLFELALPGTPRGNDFASVIVNKTEIEVVEVKETADNKYTVVMKVKSVSPSAMAAMVEIVRPLKEGDLNAFNFTDGFTLLQEKQPSVKIQQTEEVRVHTSL